MTRAPVAGGGWPMTRAPVAGGGWPMTATPQAARATAIGGLRPARAQRGSASLIGLALCAFIVIATLVTADVGALAFAKARAQTAADLAALAAVTPIPGPFGPGSPVDPGGLGSAAERARLVATANGADLTACSCDSLDTTISVRVRARLIPFATTVGVRAYARAVLMLAADPPAVATGPGAIAADPAAVRKRSGPGGPAGSPAGGQAAAAVGPWTW